MSWIADRFVVVLDANVLYPFAVRDVLLSFYERGLFRARWTEDIVREWTDSLIRNRADVEDSVLSQVRAMREFFDEAWVTGYEPLIPGLALPDPDDRHVLAAAIVCGAQHIVTENTADFPADALARFDIEAIQADEFLARTFDLYETEAVDALSFIRRIYQRPSYSPPEFVMHLTANRMPKLAGKVRPFARFL